MVKFKKISKTLSKYKKLGKKVGPAINLALSSLDVIDNVAEIAKPYFEDQRKIKLEDSKKIYAYQINSDEKVRIFIKNTRISVNAESQTKALEKLISSLKNLQKNKLLSGDKKKRKKELKLIKKMNKIDLSELNLNDYLFRILIEENKVNKKKFKVPNINLFSNK